MARGIAAASILVASLISGGTAIAQQPPGMVRVTTVHVKLGQQRHFESLVPKVWDALKKAGGKTPYFVSAGVSDPGAYIMVSPVSGLAEVDAQEKSLNQAFASVPEVTAQVFAASVSVDDEIWMNRPDLGYQPAQPRLPEAEQGFLRVAILHVDPAQTPALEAAFKERNALRKKYGITDAVGVAQLVLGADGPAYAILTSAKDEVDFYTQNAKNVAKMGAEWQASLDKSGPMIRRIEFATSVARPALDYKP
jgi:hypothetical protein